MNVNNNNNERPLEDENVWTSSVVLFLRSCRDKYYVSYIIHMKKKVVAWIITGSLYLMYAVIYQVTFVTLMFYYWHLKTHWYSSSDIWNQLLAWIWDKSSVHRFSTNLEWAINNGVVIDHVIVVSTSDQLLSIGMTFMGIFKWFCTTFVSTEHALPWVQFGKHLSWLVMWH